MRQSIEAEVFSLISKTLGVPRDVITLTDPISGLTADSIQLFELLLAFEQWYKEEVDYEDLANIVTVEDIVRYVCQRKGVVFG